MYTSRYNILDDRGQVLYAPGEPIDEVEAVRQGIIRPPLAADGAIASPSPTAETQVLKEPTPSAERKKRV